ncbi:MAG: type II secretion system F family protein [Candidatus Eremiobacteraeota bacterium]|nr:type II secretion system F family protein [Candidatus Eremiobacteraeota bacterium]
MTMTVVHEIRQAVQDSHDENAQHARIRESRARSRRPAEGALAVFLRSFSMMSLAGVTMHNSLTLLGYQSEDEPVRLASMEMAQEIAKGHRLSKAMSLHPHVFSKFQLSLIQVAERTGNLDEILLKMAEYEEKSAGLNRKVKGALTYPACIFVVCLLMLIFAPPFVFSGIFPMLKSMGAGLPWITRVVIGLSELVRNPLFVLTLAALAYAGGHWLIERFTHPQKRLGTYRRLLKVPVLGVLLRSVAVSRFCRSLGVQLSAGGEIVEALALAGQGSQNPVLQEAIPKALASLRAGRELSRCLKETEFFPDMVIHLLRVGEESGEIPEMLRISANWFDDEVDQRIETLASCIEPLVMLIMGACVGVVVIALLLPMMNLVSSL